MKSHLRTAAVLLSVLAWTVPILAQSVEGRNNSQQRIQISGLYPEIPGDPEFRVEDKAVPGSKAVLARHPEGLSIALDTSGLEPGAYSAWIRIFNNPELCTGGEGVEGSLCSRGDDIKNIWDPCVSDSGIPNADPGVGESTCSVYWIAGLFVGPDGKAHVSAEVGVNEWPGFVILGADKEGTPEQALWNVFGSEVHIVLRFHGEALVPEGPIFFFEFPGGPPKAITADEAESLFNLGRQVARVLGNCAPFPPFFEDPANCFDAQLAIFPPLPGNKHKD